MMVTEGYQTSGNCKSFDRFKICRRFGLTDEGSQRLSKRLQIVNLLASVNKPQSNLVLEDATCTVQGDLITCLPQSK